MNDMLKRLAKLDTARQVAVAIAAIGVIALVLLMGRVAATPNYSMLYAGLDPQAASDVIAALEADGVPFELRGSAIYVPEAQRDRARLDLAGAGLPSGGSAGYELLESLSGFGTTAQMFDAAYRRAQEGELARTIAASPDIRAARVHIAQVQDGPFARQSRASASVTITMARGGLAEQQANAIRHLVAAALPGLAPTDVSVIDAAAGRVLQPDGGDSGQNTQRADELRANLERLLEARVGPGRAVVELTIETVNDSETLTERVIDPDSRVAVTSDVEEDLENSAGGAGGAVTVASNLPDGDANADASENRREITRTRERTTFEVSEVLRERVRGPGDIKRLSVAVLVDGEHIPNEDGDLVWQARSSAELTALENLVKSAVGFDEARGDQLTLQSLEFPQIESLGTQVSSPGFVDEIPMALIVQLAILGAVALALGLLVIKPILTRGAPEPNLLMPEDTDLLVTPTSADNTAPPTPEEQEAAAPPSEILKAKVAERGEDAAALVKSWIDSDVMAEANS